MERVGLRFEREFDHPRVPSSSPLQRQVLYRS